MDFDEYVVRLGAESVRLTRRHGAARWVDHEDVAREVAFNIRFALECRASDTVEDVVSMLVATGTIEAGSLESREASRLSGSVLDYLGTQVERLLVWGILAAPPRPKTSSVRGGSSREPAAKPAPKPAPAAKPAPEPPAQEAALPGDLVDQDMQAEALRAAAEDGVPFCEECEKARAEQAAAAGAA